MKILLLFLKLQWKFWIVYIASGKISTVRACYQWSFPVLCSSIWLLLASTSSSTKLLNIKWKLIVKESLLLNALRRFLNWVSSFTQNQWQLLKLCFKNLLLLKNVNILYKILGKYHDYWEKKSAYRRHRISWSMRIVAQIFLFLLASKKGLVAFFFATQKNLPPPAAASQGAVYQQTKNWVLELCKTLKQYLNAFYKKILSC